MMEQNGTINYMYYEKPISNPLTIMCKSAISSESQSAILVQEVFQRMVNTSEDQEQSVRNNIINKLNQKLKLSRYDLKRRQNSITRGLLK